jgi:hypothetical protein
MEELQKMLEQQLKLIKALHRDNLELYKLLATIAEIKTIKLK